MPCALRRGAVTRGVVQALGVESWGRVCQRGLRHLWYAMTERDEGTSRLAHISSVFDLWRSGESTARGRVIGNNGYKLRSQ